MTSKLLILVFSLCLCYNAYSQEDSCKPQHPSSNPFDVDVPLDKVKYKYLDSLFKIADFRFSYDYSGSLTSPGQLFNEVNFSNYDLLSTNLSFSDKNNVQKVGFMPFRLFDSIGSNILRNTKLNISLKSAITTFGIAIGGDNSDPRIKGERGKWLKKKRDSIFRTGHYKIPQTYPKECQEKIRQENLREANRLLYVYDSIRTKRVFKWSAGYSMQTFSILSSKGDNPVTDSLNYFAVKANILTLTCSYGLNMGQWQFSGTYNHIYSRQSAVKGQDKILYHAFQVTAGYRAICFLKGEKLKSNENFIKTLFIPSLNIGVSYDYKFTDGETKFIEEGIQKSRVITPYIDILLTPASQFRFGFPFTKNKTVVDAKTLQLGALIQYSFKLVNLN